MQIVRDEAPGVHLVRGFRDQLGHNAQQPVQETQQHDLEFDPSSVEGFNMAGPSIKLPVPFLKGIVQTGEITKRDFL